LQIIDFDFNNLILLFDFNIKQVITQPFLFKIKNSTFKLMAFSTIHLLNQIKYSFDTSYFFLLFFSFKSYKR